MEHFDVHYNPVDHKKIWVHLWLLLFLAIKMNIKWLEKFCLHLSLPYLGSKCSLDQAESPQQSDISPFSPFSSIQGDMLQLFCIFVSNIH